MEKMDKTPTSFLEMEDKNPVLVSKVFLGFQQPNPGQTRPEGVNKKKKKKVVFG